MTSEHVLQKVIFPHISEPDVVPLYLDADEWTGFTITQDPLKFRRGAVPPEPRPTPLRLSHVNAVTMLNGRRGLTLSAGTRVSLGTYFNAFPTSYWRRWTVLSGVRLRVLTEGAGDIIVYRSNARGVIQTVDAAHVDGPTTSVFDLNFENFLDGGWYWFDLISRSEDFQLIEADWLAPEDAPEPGETGGLTISITTLNRVEYCLALLKRIGSDPDALSGIDEIIVVDQGTQKIKDDAEYESAVDALGGRLRLIEQGNVGGSGGFSRGMYENLVKGVSDYHMLLDDDVTVEPESIRRALVFARLCTSPTIVGGHMFDMYDKTKLHAFAESIETSTFMWGPVTPDRHDFTSSNLRQTEWLHQRVDVAYNGWWMSLIPVKIIKEIGLSLPVFIKWDDAEYSLRAAEHGYSTVSLPGATVWHVSWVDKDDSHDWQAFYHARNRLITALLHSPHRKGGRLPISNLASDMRHLLTMDYYAVALRQLAYESVLAGPQTLHPELATRLPQIRQLAKEYTESTLIRDLGFFRHFPKTEYFGTDPTRDPSKPRGLGLYGFAARYAARHWLRRPRPGSDEQPEVHIPRSAPWWRIVVLDSIAISNAEGSGVTWHVRSRTSFRKLLRSSLRLNLEHRRRWSELRRQYRDQLEEITSPEVWARTLGLNKDEH